MSEGLTQSRGDFRSRALLWAVQNCSSRVADLLSWHPGAESLRAQVDAAEGVSLGQLLWRELAAAERECIGPRADDDPDPPQGNAASYWLRRRRLGQWQQWRAVTRELPGDWLKLLELPASGVGRLSRAIGLDVVTVALAGQTPAELVRSLAPLGNELACRVATRLREPKWRRVPEGVGARWREAYKRAARLVNAEQLVAVLGRGLLAALFRRLPEEGRRAASNLSRSTLPSLLEGDEFLEPVTEEELEVGRGLVARRIAAVCRGEKPGAEVEGA